MKYWDMCLPYTIDDCDRSYPTPEMMLLWRLEDLRCRLEELTVKGAPYSDGYIYTEHDIRSAQPMNLKDICKTERAIELAIDDLVNKYGLPNPDMRVSEACAGQMSLPDILPPKIPKAA